MTEERLQLEDKVDKLYADTAVLAAVQGEMSKRLDDAVGCIEILNHNSTEIKVAVGKVEVWLSQHDTLIANTKRDITNMVKTGLTILGVVLTIVFFAINYFGG